MLFSDSYCTIHGTGEILFKDRGSKFHAFIFPVRSEVQIKAHLAALKKLHPSANHHCYAWRLGPDKLQHRYNDDGEPSGTAGKPIYSQIQKNDLSDVLIVVVRYFGGTLLGTGGLINAYRTSAEQVIVKAGVVEKKIFFAYELKFAGEDVSAVMRLLKEAGAVITINDYGEEHFINFHIEKERSEQFENKMKELYKVKLKFIGTIT
jgi:uncharacterized YigZ family protein